jgi:hypothetical protein
MIRRPVPRRFALLLPLLVLAGCAPAGGGGVDTGRFKGAERDVAQTVSDLTDAARDKDGGRACSQLLSRALVSSLGPGCAKALKEQFDDADAFKLDVRSITVEGDRATARVTSDFDGHKRATTLPLVRERGGWRIDRLSS